MLLHAEAMLLCAKAMLLQPEAMVHKIAPKFRIFA